MSAAPTQPGLDTLPEVGERNLYFLEHLTASHGLFFSAHMGTDVLFGLSLSPFTRAYLTTARGNRLNKSADWLTEASAADHLARQIKTRCAQPEPKGRTAREALLKALDSHGDGPLFAYPEVRKAVAGALAMHEKALAVFATEVAAPRAPVVPVPQR